MEDSHFDTSIFHEFSRNITPIFKYQTTTTQVQSCSG